MQSLFLTLQGLKIKALYFDSRQDANIKLMNLRQFVFKKPDMIP